MSRIRRIEAFGALGAGVAGLAGLKDYLFLQASLMKGSTGAGGGARRRRTALPTQNGPRLRRR